jgi:hypothetical protein
VRPRSLYLGWASDTPALTAFPGKSGVCRSIPGMATRDRKKRLDVELSDAEWARLESERGLVSRSAWVRARLFPPAGSVEGVAGAVRGVALPAAASSSAAPPELAGLRNLHGTITDPRHSPAGDLSRIPGVVRGSSLVKRDVRPIPKGKGK